MPSTPKARRRKSSPQPSSPEQAEPWTEDELKRCLALRISVCEWVKPPQTVKLYGITQRLSAKRMKVDGSANDYRHKDELDRIPDLSAEQCQFLYDVIKKVLNGERDAFKAFGLALACE